MKPWIQETRSWIKTDWHSNPIRLIAETLVWIASITASLTMALTVPNSPLLFVYSIWWVAMVTMTVCAYSRHSFGLVALYFSMTIIDGIGLIRLLVS